MHPICEPEARCKCCGAAAPLCGVVDLNKNCEMVRRNVLPCCGIPVYYYRCPECKFIFTTAFDGFTQADFAGVIYNDEYVLVDPDYVSARPNANAGLLQNLFPTSRPSRVLDYGGGNGKLAGLLAERGFPNVDCYDPHVERYAQRPPHKYDCIVSFEVFEHTTDPLGLVAELNDLLADPGLVIFSTFLQPPDIDQFGLSWWYAAPRNGHVSLYSRESLVSLTRRLGLQLFSHNQNLHLLVRNLPDFAEHLLRRPPT